MASELKFSMFSASSRAEPFKPCQKLAEILFNNEWSMKSETFVVVRVCLLSIPRNENKNKNNFECIQAVPAVAKLSSTVTQ